MDTLLLDQETWDLTLTTSGDIAVASNPYALAQDAASECRYFTGDDYYDTTHGIPYWRDVLGQKPQLTLIRSYLLDAALLVPEVVSAAVYFSSFENRELSGQVQVTDVDGNITAGSF